MCISRDPDDISKSKLCVYLGTRMRRRRGYLELLWWLRFRIIRIMLHISGVWKNWGKSLFATQKPIFLSGSQDNFSDFKKMQKIKIKFWWNNDFNLRLLYPTKKTSQNLVWRTIQNKNLDCGTLKWNFKKTVFRLIASS